MSAIPPSSLPAAASANQYLRKCTLLVTAGTKALDLSEMQIQFSTQQQDEQSPSNARIRVFNLSAATVDRVQKEFSEVVLQAGYAGNFGVVFQGTIKQFRVGRLDNITTYLDILAADGDLAYNWAIVNKTLAAGSTFKKRAEAAVEAMQPYGIKAGTMTYPDSGGILPRGKVLFGYAKAQLASNVQTMGATWSIQDGRVNVLPLTGYLPGEAVVLTAATGLVGRVEQTQQGMRARCLLNPRIRIGGAVKIDNASINKTLQQKDSVIPGAQLPYDRWTGVQQFASVAADGMYRVYVAEHSGDTRGGDWYTDIVCLTIDPVSQTCKAYG